MTDGPPLRTPQASASAERSRVLRELTEDLGIPVLAGFMCGHVADKTTLPYGIAAELDVGAGSLALIEAAVT